MSTDRIDANEPTRREESGAVAAQHRLFLRVFDGDVVRSVPLAEDCVVVIGRSSRADVPIDAPSVSRVHARLHVGKTLQLEDMGSANGTQVRGVPLAKGQRVDVLPGDEILVGKVPCLVQGAPRFAPPPRLRSLRTHEYFEARLDDECVAVASSTGCFALLRLRVEGAAGAAFEEDLMAVTRPSDVVAWYGPGEYEVLLPGVPNAKPRSDEILAGLDRGGWKVRVGAACYPRDGRTPDALIEAAGGALRPVPPEEVVRALGEIVVEAPAMRNLHKLVARVAASNISVLLLGETGTGKEVFASEIHKLSPRAAGPFCKVNCAAFTETLVESELFGHEKGAFTGADRTRPGLLETARGGTVFLDEVGELSQSLQAKLLRVLEDRKVRRVGGREEHALDVRFVAATNRDLEREIEKERFRGDLFFRLNGFPLEIPPLRERVGEIEPLARRFLALGAIQARCEEVPTLTAGALALLEQYAWPGNIRELRNVMDRVLVIIDGSVITPEALRQAHPKFAAKPSRSEKFMPGPPAPPTVAEAASTARADLTAESVRPLDDVRDDAEKDYLRRVLELCRHNQTRAAELLDISRGKIVTLIEKYDLPRPRGGG
jgi:two-component system response regulator AtoC